MYPLFNFIQTRDLLQFIICQAIQHFRQAFTLQLKSMACLPFRGIHFRGFSSQKPWIIYCQNHAWNYNYFLWD